jgi:RNA polymerase sigma factor (sigma-70 family)
MNVAVERSSGLSADEKSPGDVVLPSTDCAYARWFEQEVEPHGSSLKSYLQGSFPAVRDVDDVVQESFLRLWKVRAAQPILSARALLFTVGRRLALDLVRRQRISPIRVIGGSTELDRLDERSEFPPVVDVDERVLQLGRAIAALPARCREIIVLHKLKGLPQREVALQLGLCEKTVENQVSRGVRLCEKYLQRRGIGAF